MLELYIVLGIIALTLLRFGYVRTHPVLRDVHVAQIPFSKRLTARDFFRRPITPEVRQSFDVLPYGTLWFAINLPLMHLTNFGEREWSYALAVLDIPFILLSFQLGLIAGLLYVALSTFQLFKAPWNMCINWLTICGVFSWVFLILSPITKLPVGVPVRQAKRVQGLLFHQHNYLYYSLLGILWLFVFWRTLLPGFLGGTWIGQLVSIVA